MQTLVTFYASYPHDRVIYSIGGCDPRRTSAGLAHAPSESYGGRICRGNFVRLNRAKIAMESKIRSLASVVSNSRYPFVAGSNVRLRRG